MAVTVSVSVEDSGASPVDGVLVQVYESDGTTYVTEGSTGVPSAGVVEFTLDGDVVGITYVLRLSKEGLYFPSGATVSVLVTDPPNPDNDFGPYASEEGPSKEVVTISVEDDEIVPAPVEGVQVLIYDEDGDYVTQGLTDVNGELDLLLEGDVSPGTSYTARLYKAGYTVPAGDEQSLAVLAPVVPPSTNIFDFVLSAIDLPTAVDPNYCRVSGYFVNVAGQPARNLRLEFKPCVGFPVAGKTDTGYSARLLGVVQSYPALVDNKILTRPVKVDTDVNGFLSIDLPREGYFDVHVHGFEDPIEIQERIYIPDAGSANIADLLFPYVVGVTYGTDPINIAVGESAEVEFTLLMSNAETISDDTMIKDLVSFSSGDPAIADVALSSEGKITVQGVAVGGTTVVVERAERSIYPTRPDRPALVVTPPTVNVT